MLLVPVPSWQRTRGNRRAAFASATAIATVLAIMAAGAIRFDADAPGSQVTIGLAASDAPPLFREEAQTTRRAAEMYAAAVADLAKAGARIVVLPELVLRLSGGPDSIDEAEPIRLAAAAHGVTAVVGVVVHEQPLDRNRALVFSSEGRLVARYDKQHLVPVWETHYGPGHRSPCSVERKTRSASLSAKISTSPRRAATTQESGFGF